MSYLFPNPGFVPGLCFSATRNSIKSVARWCLSAKQLTDCATPAQQNRAMTTCAAIARRPDLSAVGPHLTLGRAADRSLRYYEARGRRCRSPPDRECCRYWYPSESGSLFERQYCRRHRRPSRRPDTRPRCCPGHSFAPDRDSHCYRS